MNVAFRAVAVAVLLSLAGAGPLAPLAAAQQPTIPPAQPAPAPPPAPLQMYPEQVKPTQEGRGTDVYDVGAVALTAAGLPFKAAICALGFAFGGIVFMSSFAARPDAAVGILDEGCGTKARWIVRGGDIRPRPSATKAFEWETHRFDWER
jgi:hypothetical protein